MIVIPNMSKPKSCDECPILIAQIVGIYCDDKDGELKRVKITECDTNKYHGHTLGEDYEMMYKDCPLIEIDDEIWEKLKPKVETMSLAKRGWITDDSNT